jgi:hypothetical protein
MWMNLDQYMTIERSGSHLDGCQGSNVQKQYLRTCCHSFRMLGGVGLQFEPGTAAAHR